MSVLSTSLPSPPGGPNSVVPSTCWRRNSFASFHLEKRCESQGSAEPQLMSSEPETKCGGLIHSTNVESSSAVSEDSTPAAPVHESLGSASYCCLPIVTRTDPRTRKPMKSFANRCGGIFCPFDRPISSTDPFGPGSSTLVRIG